MTQGRHGFYVASRASIPERPAMWQRFRQRDVPIRSTWIDEAGPGETASFADLWTRIQAEISTCSVFVLYVGKGDLPLKGAYVEVGMALSLGIPVRVVADDDSFRRLGNWVGHPLVSRKSSIEEALGYAVDLDAWSGVL